MTTFTNFAPPRGRPYQFIATLDGTQYLITIPWNMSGQRWYLSITTLDGQQILFTPLISSPTDANINLVKGYFNSTFYFREETQNFEINP